MPVGSAVVGTARVSSHHCGVAHRRCACRYGAHQIGGDDAEGGQTAREGEAFAEEGIDMILQNRTEKRQIGSRAGNSFSTATFAAPDVRPLPATLDDEAYDTQKASCRALPSSAGQDGRHGNMC